MCLNTATLTQEYPEDSDIGWKVMYRWDSDYGVRYSGECYTSAGKEICYQPGVEYERVVYTVPTIPDLNGGGYRVGFHIFTSREAAWKWLNSEGNFPPAYRIIKVRWRHLLASGFQETFVDDKKERLPTVVAKYMTIVEEVV